MPGKRGPADDGATDDSADDGAEADQYEAGDYEKPTFGDRLRSAFLKPAPPGSAQAAEAPLSLEELEAESKSLTDKERLVGLLAAPWAAAIGILITASLINRDPAAYLKNGQANKLHVSVSLYHEVLIALLALSVLMLVLAWLRKRLYLGIIMALYGLTLFNLHWWGFAIPYIMCAAWLLVRAYRLQRSVKEAGGGSRTYGARNIPSGPRPRGNKRYTPPTSRS